MTTFGFPIPISRINSDFLNDFDCGHLEMNEWLAQKALSNEKDGGSRTFVVLADDSKVAAYFALSAGAVSRESLASSNRHGRPRSVPVNVLARLAVDKKYQHRGLGYALVKYALDLTIQMRRYTGVYALVVNPLNLEVVSFYKRLGFKYRSNLNILYFPIRSKSGDFLTL